jgi:predicted nucleic acid-binding protein
VTLCDAGPLFALVDGRQGELHRRCREALAGLSAPLVTTWPCYTEAMYLAHRSGGWPMQELLWRMFSSGSLILHDLDPERVARVRILMEQYRDTPMNLADASLVAIAEQLDQTRVFTLDRDFQIYRLSGIGSFDIVPD